MSMQKLSDPVQLVLNIVIKIAESKKSENIRCFSVSEKMWMTDYILIVDIKNKIHYYLYVLTLNWIMNIS